MTNDIRFKAQLAPRLRRPEGKAWEVVIIEAGESLNGFSYSEACLQEAAGLFEGAPVYVYRIGGAETHLSDGEKDANPRGYAGNQIGRIEQVRWDGDEGPEGALVGSLLIDDPEWREKLSNMAESGAILRDDGKDQMGLSIDAEGIRRGADVVEIDRVNSVDVVTRPAAGGKFLRLVAGLASGEQVSGRMPGHNGGMVSSVEDAGASAAAGRMNMAENDALMDRVAAMETRLTEAELTQPVGQIRMLAGKLMTAIGEDRVAIIKQMRSLLAKLVGDDAEPVPTPQKESEGGEAAERLASLVDRLEGLLQQAVVQEDAQARVAVQEALEEARGTTADDPKDTEIAKLQERLRSMAIEHELARHVADLGIIDADAAARLVDLETVSVAEDYSEVAGLREALEALLEARPYLKRAEEKKKLQESERARLQEAAPAHQRVTREDGDGQPHEVIGERMARLAKTWRTGDPSVALQLRRLGRQRDA